MTKLDLRQTLTRQSDLIPLSVLSKRITIIGAGAVGSWTTLALVKMGFGNITVYDYDTIDIENMNCQFYPISAIGEQKVSALKRMVKDFTTLDILAYDTKVDEETSLVGDIIISAVDSMAVRRMLFGLAKSRGAMFLDPRMGAETMHLYAMNLSDPNDCESYLKSWYSDEDADQAACTSKATIYCANILAGLVSKTVKNIACGDDYTRILRYDLTHNHHENWMKRKTPPTL